MYCLETWRQRTGRAQGAGISALGSLRKVPLPGSHQARRGVQGQGMDTVTIGSLKFPSLAARKLKCTPMGVGGEEPFPQPHNLWRLAFGWVVSSAIGADGGASPDGWC